MRTIIKRIFARQRCRLSTDPNPWGFFDMHGNSLGMDADWHEAFSNNIKLTQWVALSGTNRVARSGSLVNDGANHTFCK